MAGKTVAGTGGWWVREATFHLHKGSRKRTGSGPRYKTWCTSSSRLCQLKVWGLPRQHPQPGARVQTRVSLWGHFIVKPQRPQGYLGHASISSDTHVALQGGSFGHLSICQAVS